MKTIQTTVYEFNELSDNAKEKAREWYRAGALDYEWWDSTYDDAERIGLKIESFDLDRNRHATGRFIVGAAECAEKILVDHGKDCETFKTATAFLAEVKAEECAGWSEENADVACVKFLHSILEDYSIILQHEMEYLLSDEAVDESIIANGYTFTASGSRF